MQYAGRNSEVLSNHAENSHFRRYFQRHLNWLVMLGLILVIGIIYWPIFDAYFVSDDYTFLGNLHAVAAQLLNGQKWDEWFVGGIVQYTFFRPFGNLSWFLDFLAYGLEPIGYHITSLTLHALASFEVFLLSNQLTSKRLTAGIAALLFAAMSVHVEPVSWIAARYDVLAGLFYFGALIFFILYLKKRRLRFYWVSLGAFVLALSSKETALTLPAIILLSEVLVKPHGWPTVTDLVKRHAPFWCIVAIRLIGFNHGYSGLHLVPSDGWWYWVDLTSLRVVDPFISDQSHELTWALVGSAAILALAYRLRREVVWGLVWIPVTLIPTITGGVSDRSFYIPSFGLSLLLAIILTSLVTLRTKVSTLLGVAALIALVISYGIAAFAHNQAYYKAGQVAEAIPLEVKTLHPTLPAGARLVFVGVPDRVPEGPLVYLTGFPGFLNLLYPNPDFQFFRIQKFPIWLDDLTKTLFFEVNHSHVTERTDLLGALERRQQCEGESYPSVRWDFSRDLQGWESWNQLSDFSVRNGALAARSDGTDPYMASPPIDIPAVAIGDVAITMRARASKSQLHGKIYWLSTDQTDFYPGLQVPFAVEADDAYHTYRIDISHSNQLFLGDHILRLRMNPVDDAAEIELKEIRIYSHCSAVQGESCSCSQ